MAEEEGNRFALYLQQKRISGTRFKEELFDLYQSLQSEFLKSSPAGFDARKKFLINNLRLQYPLSDD